MDKPHAKMPTSQRAKQFAPFDAVVGLRQALKEKEKIKVEKKELFEDEVEEINITLKNLKTGQTIAVVWYDNLRQNYTTTNGEIIKIDAENKYLEIENTLIFFKDIYEII